MEKWKEAYNDYEKGLKYKEIANKFGVSVNTVKSWKTRYWNKDKLEECAHKNEESMHTKKKSGAPKGNKNAIGNSGGAPEGNKNNYKHGIYEQILYSSLSPEERKLMDDNEFDEIRELKNVVHLCDIQILRFLSKINKLENSPKQVVVKSFSQTAGESMGFPIETKTTETISKEDLVLRYSNEIEKIKSRKIKCLELINKLGNTEGLEPVKILDDINGDS